MDLHTLSSITHTRKKRGGQGHGSGRGKTSGRGTKGQKARGKIPFTRYSGGSLSFVKRLPFMRGKSRNFGYKPDMLILNVGLLQVLPKDSIVDLALLVKHHLVPEKAAKVNGVKILGDGELTLPLTVTLPVSKGAEVKILKAGGKLDVTHS